MTAKEQHDLYVKAMESLSEEDLQKMIKEGAMAPALLVDIGRTLAILTDAVASIASAIKGGADEETGDQGPGGNEPGHIKEIHGGLPEGDPEA